MQHALKEEVKDELCGKYIVVSNPSNEFDKLSKEELLDIFSLLLDHIRLRKWIHLCLYLTHICSPCRVTIIAQSKDIFKKYVFTFYIIF